MDFRCNNHMSGNKSLFFDLNEYFWQHVKLGNNSSIYVMGKWNIQVHIDDNNVYMIVNVFYVPTLKTILLALDNCKKMDTQSLFK